MELTSVDSSGAATRGGASSLANEENLLRTKGDGDVEMSREWVSASALRAMSIADANDGLCWPPVSIGGGGEAEKERKFSLLDSALS